MFRREWRQQILVIALLVVAAAAAIASVTIAYNSSAADDAEFGSANHLIRFDGADQGSLEAGLAAARERFGTTDVIGHRSLRVPGSVDQVEFRSQDPHGPYGDDALRSTEAATRQAPARSRSPTAWPRSSDSRSGILWRSMAVAGPSLASSRTHVI